MSKTDTETCPVCGTDMVEGGSIVVTQNGCYQGSWCIKCPAEWNDLFKYVGYELTGMQDD